MEITHKLDKFLTWSIAIGLLVSVLLAGIIGVTTSMLLQSYSLVLMGVVCLLTGMLSSRMYRQVGLAHVLIINLAVIYFALRALFSPSQDLGIGDMFLLFSAASVYGVVNLIKDPKLLKFSVAAIIILFALNVLNYFPAFATFRDELLPFAQGNESSGMFNHRNFCSNLVMQGTLLLIVYAVMPISNKASEIKTTYVIRGLAGLAGISGVCSLLSMGARGALLGLIAGLIILFLCLLVSKKARVLNITLGIGVACMVPTILVFGKVEFLKKAEKFEDRLEYFAMAVDQVPDSIMIGSGSMSYSYKYYEYWGGLGTHHLDHTWVHNEFLQVLTDYGIIGIIFLITVICWIFYVAIINMFDAAVRRESVDTKIVIALSVMGGFLVNCLVSFPAHSYVNLMIVAMVAGWIVHKNKGGAVLSKASLYFYRLPFIFMGFFMIYLSVPRMKAARVFSNYSIYTDSMNWNPHKQKDGHWLSALEAVNKVSPNYISYSRLAALYIIQAEMVSDKEIYARKALECSELALKRHPYYTSALLTKSKSLWYLGEYELADENFEHLASYTKYRRKYYRVNTSWASCLLEAGNYYLDEGDLVLSALYFRKALNAWLPDNRNRAYLNALRSLITSGYSKVLIMSKEYDELDELMENMHGSKDKYPSKESKKNCLIQARMFATYGHSLFMRRKPSLAYKYFIWAEQNYSYSKRKWKTEFSESDLSAIGKMKRVVKILKEARIQPAK
jgi:O-antigen ligase